MPKTITKEVTLYTFKELVDLEKVGTLKRACEKARWWLQEGQTFDGWWDHTYDTWKSALAQIGFDNAEISFSGFWSQGDGASFTCKSVDMDKLIEFLLSDIEPNPAISYDGKTEDFRGWLLHKVGGKPDADAKFDKLIGKVYAEVTRISHQYSHHNTCDFDMHEDDNEFFRSAVNINLFSELGHTCERLRVSICRAIYDDLEKEFEWLTSDEQLIETAEANEYTFNKDGKMETE